MRLIYITLTKINGAYTKKLIYLINPHNVNNDLNKTVSLLHLENTNQLTKQKFTPNKSTKKDLTEREMKIKDYVMKIVKNTAQQTPLKLLNEKIL